MALLKEPFPIQAQKGRALAQGAIDLDLGGGKRRQSNAPDGVLVELPIASRGDSDIALHARILTSGLKEREPLASHQSARLDPVRLHVERLGDGKLRPFTVRCAWPIEEGAQSSKQGFEAVGHAHHVEGLQPLLAELEDLTNPDDEPSGTRKPHSVADEVEISRAISGSHLAAPQVVEANVLIRPAVESE